MKNIVWILAQADFIRRLGAARDCVAAETPPQWHFCVDIDCA